MPSGNAYAGKRHYSKDELYRRVEARREQAAERSTNALLVRRRRTPTRRGEYLAVRGGAAVNLRRRDRRSAGV